MIEDALKSTRNAQRLLILVCVLSLVFLLSINSDSTKQGLVSDLKQLRTLAGTEYAVFIRERAAQLWEQEVGPHAKGVFDELNELLDQAELKVLGASQIADIFRAPVHIGRLRPEDLRFADETVTLSELDDLFASVPWSRPARVTNGDLRKVIPTIVDFVRDNTSEGMTGTQASRISGAQVYPVADTPDVGDTFLAGDMEQPLLLLTFFFHPDTDRLAPVFEHRFSGSTKTLPGSSWKDWLSDGNSANLVGKVDDDWRWLPKHELTREQRSIPLGTLIENLEGEISRTRAENQAINLPGLEVPGSLAVLAIPLAVLGLGLSMASHLAHLERLSVVHKHIEKFHEFAWGPLAPGRYGWRGEFVSTVLALPVIVLVFLALRAASFEISAGFTIAIGLASAAGSALVGARALNALLRLRRNIYGAE